MRFCCWIGLLALGMGCGKEPAGEGKAKAKPVPAVQKTQPPTAMPVKALADVNATPGSLIWQFTTGPSHYGVQSSPALGPDGAIYFGAGNGRVYALEAADGNKRWEFQTGDAVLSSPAVGRDGTVYVGSTGQTRASNLSRTFC